MKYSVSLLYSTGIIINPAEIKIAVREQLDSADTIINRVNLRRTKEIDMRHLHSQDFITLPEEFIPLFNIQCMAGFLRQFCKSIITFERNFKRQGLQIALRRNHKFGISAEYPAQ